MKWGEFRKIHEVTDEEEETLTIYLLAMRIMSSRKLLLALLGLK